VLSDSIRNLVYPASICVGVGSLWMLAWSSHLAERTGYLEAPPLTAQQITERQSWDTPDASALTPVPSKPPASSVSRAD
jgi:hypothetical protein